MTRHSHNPGRTSRITAAEAVVFLAVVVLVVAVLVPTLRSHRAIARLIEARQQTRQIAGAVERCYADTQLAHLFVSDHGIDVLIGPGEWPDDVNTPAARPWHDGRTADIETALMQPPMCDCDAVSGWNGPYVEQAIEPDPWGCRYMVNIRQFAPDVADARSVFVLSAGPNRIIDTPFNQASTSATIGGDDIAWRVR